MFSTDNTDNIGRVRWECRDIDSPIRFAKVSLFMPEPWYRIPNMALIPGGLIRLPNNGFFGGVRQRGSLKLSVADSRELL